jgi:hypothetical protein
MNRIVLRFIWWILPAISTACGTLVRDNPALRFIIDDDQATIGARLMLVKATSLVIRTGLNMLSIDALEEM